jgi:hypothetical protein
MPILLLPIVWSSADAYREREYFPVMVELVYSDELRAVVRAIEEPLRITEIMLVWKGDTIKVPSSEFEDLEYPDLGSIHISGRSDQNKPAKLSLSIGFGSTSCGVEGCTCEATFRFIDGKYVERYVLEITSETSDRFYTKLPGQAEDPIPSERDCGT